MRKEHDEWREKREQRSTVTNGTVETAEWQGNFAPLSIPEWKCINIFNRDEIEEIIERRLKHALISASAFVLKPRSFVTTLLLSTYLLIREWLQEGTTFPLQTFNTNRWERETNKLLWKRRVQKHSVALYSNNRMTLFSSDVSRTIL
jgi:hypothetical protein